MAASQISALVSAGTSARIFRHTLASDLKRSVSQSRELGLGNRCSLSPIGITAVGVRSGRSHIVGAKRSGTNRNGGVAEAVEDETIPEDDASDFIWNGRILPGRERDFWEGEQWDAFGFVMQYLWAFGILIALMACGVAVVSYNSGATDIRDTEVFKEALENQVEMDSSRESSSAVDVPVSTDAPPLQSE